jgi:hypothetical protein
VVSPLPRPYPHPAIRRAIATRWQRRPCIGDRVRHLQRFINSDSWWWVEATKQPYQTIVDSPLKATTLLLDNAELGETYQIAAQFRRQ